MTPSRRQVLLGIAGGAGVAALEGCGPTPEGARTLAPGATTPTPGRRGSVPWESLRQRTTGTLRLPDDQGYDAHRTLFDRRFDHVRPAAVLSVASPKDVQAALAFARRHDLPLAVRAGGHSYTGGSVSTGLVIDLRPLAAVSVTSGDRARIGAGAALIDVYSALGRRGVSVPAGSCPAVGVGGLALGGGQGVVSRTYGLTCDRVRSMRVVLADGRLVTASPTSEPDLFWALRGGGGSFGVVTSFTMQTHDTGRLATSYHTFDWDDAPAVLSTWSRHLPPAERRTWSTCHLLSTPERSGGPPTVTVSCVRVGSADGLRAALAPFLGEAPRPTYALVRERDYLDAMYLYAGCSSSDQRQCHVAGQSPHGTLPRDAFVAGSAYFTHAVPRAAAEDLAAAVEARQRDRSLEAGGAAFDTWGGAIGDVAPDATAFVHRDVAYGAQYTASWQHTPGDHPLAANRASLAAIAKPLARHATGAAYQNYADPTLVHPLRAYYGDNLARLEQVKRAYDPDDVLAPPQGIPPG